MLISKKVRFVMANIGIMKSFDKLGRIVIPKELRDRYALFDEVEIIATKDGVLTKNPEYALVKSKANDAE